MSILKLYYASYIASMRLKNCRSCSNIVTSDEISGLGVVNSYLRFIEMWNFDIIYRRYQLVDWKRNKRHTTQDVHPDSFC
jgi:hypothetical protein